MNRWISIGFPFNNHLAPEWLSLGFQGHSSGILKGCVLAIDGFCASQQLSRKKYWGRMITILGKVVLQ